MKLAPLLFWLIFGFAIVKFSAGYGKQWDLSGKYGMPTTLLSPDGRSYRDGSPIDDVTLAFVRRGIEQEARLVTAGILLLLFTAMVVKIRRSHRMQTEAFERELRHIREMQPREDERK